MNYPESIPQWRVAAALKLLGLHDQHRPVEIQPGSTTVKVGHNGHVLIPVAPNTPTQDTVVVGIDPETGDCQENVITPTDAMVFPGAGMYLDGVVAHKNGTRIATVKRRA